jgi:paired amphipathic helix protein Sin3a
VRLGDPFYTDEGLSERDREMEWRKYIASYTTFEDTEGIDKRLLTPFLLQRNLHAIGYDLKTSDSFPPACLPVPTTTEPDAADDTTHTAQPSTSAVGEKLLNRFLNAKNEEKLILRIALNNYHPLFQPGSYEGFFEELRERAGGKEGVEEAEEVKSYREEQVKERFVMNNDGMRDLSREEVEKRNEGFSALTKGDEVLAKEDGVANAGDGMEVDG